MLECRNEVEKQVSRAALERRSVLSEEENDCTREIEENTEDNPWRSVRGDQPRWNPRGSTIAGVNGLEKDITGLPDCICKPYYLNYRQLLIRHNRKSAVVSKKKVADAKRFWRQKTEACLNCCESYWPGIKGMSDIARLRLFQAQLPPELRIRRRKPSKFAVIAKASLACLRARSPLRLNDSPRTLILFTHVTNNRSFSGPLSLLSTPTGPFQGHTDVLHSHSIYR